ncbi:MAG: DUF4012 domain-containing protein [Candidatus Gracilibacteria bacterium]|nr:DUF4012 domain-containing protein [Candidatus Gracilibacteria bacterium]MDD2908944.1 DUF4012 domain-containing protein [Candidatus Gracilibacteria bacterium]
MELEKDKINDISGPKLGEKAHPIDLLVFFPRFKLKALRLNQTKLFSDIYLELKTSIDLRIKKILKVSKLSNENFSDIIKKKHNKIPLLAIINRKRQRILFDPLSIIEPLGYVIRNMVDIRLLEIIPTKTTYPDIYRLPLQRKQRIRKFYNSNKVIIKKGLSRGAIGTIIASIIITSLGLLGIGYKNYIQSEVTKGYQDIYGLKTIRDSQALKQKALEIKGKFTKLDLLFMPANIIGNNFLYSNNSIKIANNIIKGGKKISETAVIGALIWEDFSFEKSKVIGDKNSPLSSLSGIKFSELFKKETNNLIKIDENLKKVIYYYSQVDSLGNPSLDNKFQSSLDLLIKYEKYISFAINNKEMLLTMVGDTKPMRYFILNQNKDEIRANGGFPGSVITLELYKGNILTYDKKDIYYYDWHLTPYKEVPPEGLNIISPNHGLRDANYSPIFLDSVNKINFFYEKAGGGTIDTVIAINQGIIEELLAKYGPISMNGIGTDISDKNFSLIMSTLVENKFEKVISPKDILFKFSANFEKKLFEKKDFTGYLEIFLSNLIAGEIPIASRDDKIQKYIDSLGIIENWKTDKGNWIYPVFTSISGNKSDRYVYRDFNVNSVITTGCQVSNDFSLISRHSFNETTRDSIKQVFNELKITDEAERQRLMGIQGAGENRQFVRILTPKGSTLNKTYGNSISVDDSNPNYTFFKFYLNTEVAQTNEIRFNYYTTPKNCQTKSIFYKQPGLNNYTFSGN